MISDDANDTVLHRASDGRVAIIMRTKNRTLLLRRAFESVLSQVHQDWHIYLVNDGGDPVGVNDLCSTYQHLVRDRLTILHNPESLGLAKALNTALRVAQGNFLVIHDDDDRWDKHFLVTLVSFLNEPQNSRFTAVMARFFYVFERIDDGKVSEINRSLVQNWPLTLKFFPLLYWNAFPPICNLIRMSAVKEIGLVNEDLFLLEDTDYLRRLLMHGDIATIKEPLAFYHVRPNRTSDNLSNSTVTMTDAYNIYDRSLGNDLIRQFIGDNPKNLGLIYAIASVSTHLDELRNKVDGNLLSDADVKRIAREVWHESNRRSLGYKLSRWVAETAKSWGWFKTS